ncbi:ABC transporter ATP-binding protein [Oceanospirillum sediminis]|uniref:ABC transporter ATP-binding protein n=1 Tax=Oceanospirillum sediminis TaxID=2760088 RepID=UPI002105351A|nr:ABC transporter ATP-binding protein [Oceanospirillum sediminis]
MKYQAIPGKQSGQECALSSSARADSAEELSITDTITPAGLWQVIRGYKKELILANVVAIIATLVSVPLPLLIPLLVDEVLLNQPGAITRWIGSLTPEHWHGPVLYILVVLIATVIMRLTALVLNVWQTRQFTLISKDIVFMLRQRLLRHLQRISMAEYETLGSGAVASYLVTDVDTIDRFISSSVSRFIVATLSLIGAAVVLLWMHWQMALFILLLNPVVVWITMRLGKHVKQLKKTQNSAFEAFQLALSETLDVIQQLRTSNREDHYIQRLINKADAVKSHSASFEWKSDATSRLSFMVFLFGFDLFRALAMLMVLFSDLSVGEMLAVFGYLWFMMGPVQEVLGIQYAWFGAKAAISRLNQLVQLEQEVVYPCQKNPFKDQTTTSIDIHDLHLSYGHNEPVLKGVSLNIQPGEKVALVGASGGGKSTMVQAILGLYPASQGQISFNGVPIEEIGLQQVRESVATVLQHPALFNGTIRDNLTLGLKFDDQALWQALEIAQLKEFVQELDEQLETLVGQKGLRLSGGQRQRLAIARMVLSDPQVVILDEATSALDTETEARLHTALETFLNGRTTLIIAHRLSAVKQADRVYVFDDGHIMEQGSHNELLEQKGLYHKLYGDHQTH